MKGPLKMPAWVKIIRDPASLYEAGAVAKCNGALSTPADVFEVLKERAQCEETEVVFCITVNTKNRPTALQEVSRGSLNGSIVEPREVFRFAVMAGAAGVILAHNHPSGDPTPSAEDITITKRLIKAGELLGINVLDHVIIGNATNSGGGRAYCSLRELGLM